MDADAMEAIYGPMVTSSSAENVTERQSAILSNQSRELVNKKKHAIFESNKKIIQMEK